MKDFFINKKPCEALVFIYRRAEREDYTYCSEVSSEIDTTKAHAVSTVNKLKDLDLVEDRKEGRRKYLRPTDRGEEIASILQDLIEKVDPTEKTDLEVNL